MRTKAFVTLLVAVVVLEGAIGGALIGGIALGKSQGKDEANRQLQSQTSQLSSRFGQRGTSGGTPTPQSTPQGGTQGTPAPQGTPQPGATPTGGGGQGGQFGRGGTVGTVEKVEGNLVTITTPQGSVNVSISNSTSIQKLGQGSLSDITPGQTISVLGNQQGDGSITATTISITTLATPQPGATPSLGIGGLLGRGGTVGTVEKVEGKTLTINTSQGSVRVLVADSTTIQKMGQGSLSDISPGESIAVSGELKDDGSIAATTIFITPPIRGSR